MTQQEENAVFGAVTAILIEHGPAAMASAFAIDRESSADNRRIPSPRNARRTGFHAAAHDFRTAGSARRGLWIRAASHPFAPIPGGM